MHSKKKQDKIKRLKDLYDLSKPEDLFTILPQELEMMEAIGIAKNWDGSKKKQEVLDIILGIAEVNNLKLDSNLVSVFIDTIIKASKGKFALNKEKS